MDHLALEDHVDQKLQVLHSALGPVDQLDQKGHTQVVRVDLVDLEVLVAQVYQVDLQGLAD